MGSSEGAMGGGRTPAAIVAICEICNWKDR